ncbi:MAG: hypothetical protein JXR10_14815 [Cyclobacteriaceae bacterium]
MSKSFEDKLKDRLGNYQVAPPANAKSAIVGSPNSGFSLTTAYHYAGAMLLLVALFMVGSRAEQVDEQLALDSRRLEIRESANQPIDNSTKVKTDLVVVEKVGEESLNETNKNIQTPRSDELPAAIVNQNNQPPFFTKSESTSFENWEVESLSFLTNDLPISSRRNPKRYFKEDEILPVDQSRIKPYFETGAFFLYNRVQPDLDDELFLSDYDSPFGLSISRVGLSANVGLQNEVTERFTLKLGAAFNTYNQNFSFAIRNIQPDSVAIIQGSEFLEPIFESEKIEIDKRISTLGGRIQGVWSIPSKYNSLLVSLEYHRLLGQGAQFTYEDNTYSISQKNQYIFEVGLQKLLLENRNSRLSIIPSFRYSVNKLQQEALTIKPFSVGVSLSYGLK